MHQDLLLCALQQPQRQEGLLTPFSWSEATSLLAFQQECNPRECGQPRPPEAGHTKPVGPLISPDKKMPVVREREAEPCSLLTLKPLLLLPLAKPWATPSESLSLALSSPPEAHGGT